MRQEFKNGSILLTGEDMDIAFEQLLNGRGRYDIDCRFCAHEDNDEYCEECSALQGCSCSCHINPPCSRCENLKFEVSPHLINYTHYHYPDGRKQWECFKGDKESFVKLEELESAGLSLTAERLATGEVSLTIGDSEADYAISICAVQDFKAELVRLVMGFDIAAFTAERKDQS